MNEPPIGRRERRKAETRKALIAAALKLFVEHGYDAVTMDDVAQEADVSRRTAFRYFPTKEALVFPQRDARLARFQALLAEDHPELTPFQSVQSACMALAANYMEDRDDHLVQEKIISSSQHLIAYERVLDRDWEDAIGAKLAEDGSSERRARILAATILGMIRGALREWAESEGQADLVKLGEEAFSLLVEGVGDV